jgi:hypothetical protein
VQFTNRTLTETAFGFHERLRRFFKTLHTSQVNRHVVYLVIAMAETKFREEVLNVVLAELLEQRGLLSLPETIRTALKKKSLPDITLAGARIIIEGRTNTGASTPKSLLKDSKARVEQGLTPICLAVMYPPSLANSASLPKLKADMSKAELTVRVISESEDGEWVKVTIDGLTDILRRSYELLVTEDVVTRTVLELETAIDSSSRTLGQSKATPDRIRKILGIPQQTIKPGSKE